LKVFERIATMVKRHPWAVIATALVLTVVLGIGLLFLKGEVSYQKIIPDDFPSSKTLARLDREFGGINYEAVLITAPSVTDPEITEFIIGLEDDFNSDPRFNQGQIQTVPGVTGKDVPKILAQPVPVVQSYLSPFIANVKRGIAESGFNVTLSGINDSIVRAQTGKGLKETVEEDYLGNPQARASVVGKHRFITPDYKATLILLKVKADMSDSDQIKFAGDLDDFLKEKLSGIAGVEFYTSGDPTLAKNFEEDIRSKTVFLFLVALALVIVVLFLAFRRISDTLMPIAFMILGLVWTFGFMGWIGVPYSIATAAVMPLLLGTAITFVVPFVARYYEEMEHGFRSVEAVGSAVTTVGVGIFLAAITNVFGFLVFQFSVLPPLKDFGLTCAFGSLFVFGLSMTLLPAIMVVRDRLHEKARERRGAEKRKTHFDGLSRRKRRGIFARTTDYMLDAFANLSIRHTSFTIAVFVVLIVAGLLSIRTLTTDSDLRKLAPQSLSSISSDMLIESYFGGRQQDVVLVSGDVLEPESLLAMKRFEEGIVADPDNNFEGRTLYTGDGITGLPNALAEANNGKLPSSKEEAEAAIKTAQDNNGFIEGGLVSAGGGAALLTLDAPGAESADVINRKMALLKANGKKYLDSAGLEFELGGITPLTKDMTRNIIPTETLSSILSLILCALVLVVIFRSIPFGLITLTVAMAGVASEAGFLALMGWPIDVVTSLSSALVIGVGVNFGILFTHRFMQEAGSSEALPADAIRNTMKNLGRANVVAALATVAGFIIVMFTGILPLKRFGGVTAVAIGCCLVTSLTLMPALLFRLTTHRMEEEKAGEPVPVQS
jgi:hypothetical protein